MSEDTSHKKYILLRQGNSLNIYFGEGKNTLKGFANKHSRDRKYGIACCKKLKENVF